MNLKNCFFILFFNCLYSLAQHSIVKNIEEIVVVNKDHPTYISKKSTTISDTIIRKNDPILGEVLKNNSLLYFKEYGRGMLSTVSFRGTTASQTAVLWNGININSPLNGSVDFNSVSTNGIQSIEIKAGGGSVLFGSGAIGGSVHLNNQLIFNGKSQHSETLGISSFDTYQGNYTGIVSTDKFSVNIGFSHFQSENDYDYKELFTWRGNQRKNENGQFKISEMNLGLGYKLNPKSMIKLFSQVSFNDRNISLVTESDPKTKYKINYSRNLVDYTYSITKFSFNPSFAFIKEEYKYFPDNEQLQYFSSGESNMLVARLNAKYDVLKKTSLSVVSEYNSTHGFGTSFGNNRRGIISSALLVNQSMNSNWQLEAGLRKEITNNYESPLLFSAGSVSSFSFYTLKLHFSKNFRIPTFNDLYWEQLGNPNLNPELSFQGEITNQFTIKKFVFTTTAYYNKIEKMIRWVPFSSEGWKPINIDNVKVLGFEGGFSFKKKVMKNHEIRFNAEYAYTLSTNEESKKQLTYIPFHRYIGNIDYSYKLMTFFVQNSFTGKVFTTSDNNEDSILKSYNLVNIGLKLRLLKNNLELNTNIINLFDLTYTSIDRPMPSRNYDILLTFKI